MVAAVDVVGVMGVMVAPREQGTIHKRVSVITCMEEQILELMPDIKHIRANSEIWFCCKDF